MTSPRAVQFDPAEGTASPDIEALLEGPDSAGPVLLFAVGPSAQDSGWAAEAAVALAQAFAARGDNVILADLSLDEPELHARVGVGNDEGLTDVFLFGASLQHTATRLPGKLFRLIPASQFTPDAAEILQHARWGGVFEELAIEKSKLLAYLPIDVDGASAFSDRVGHTVVLAAEDDLSRVQAALSPDADIICVLTPPGPKARAVPAASAEAGRREVSAQATEPATIERLDDAAFEKIRIPKDSAREALIADLRKRQRAALMAPPPTIAPLPEAGAAAPPAAVRPMPRIPRQPVDSVEEPLFSVRSRQPARRRPYAWLTWVLVLVIVAAAVAGGWYFWQSRYAPRPAPLVRPSQPAAQQPQQQPTEQAQPVIPQEAGTRLPYSVAVASYPVLRTASDQLTQLSKAQSGIPFYIAPLLVQGKTFYRLMAGPVADSAGAVALRDTLIAKRIKTITSGWDVVSTPYAFLLGEYTTRGEADAVRDTAARKNVPAYVVDVARPNGRTTFRVYAGAFTGPGDADFMRGLLKSAGYTDNLVERTGSIS